jgi:GGDEF domain-containing protein
MTFVLIVLIVFQISRRFTTPVLEISSVINRMTDFDFNMPANLKTYAGQRDEIGTVAAAMVDMHDNYTEFMDQVNYINKEIQQINIEKNELLTLEVSRNNPFRGVIDSMNVLLAKIHQYFDELKETNKEVVAKNEQLTRSKKELMEQLEKVDRQNEYINFLALHDPLTKLPNRRQFTDLLNERLAEQKKGAVLLLDLDDFKGINDTRGHVFGDRVIEHMALRLSEITDEDTIVSRFGGTNFLS